MLLITDIVGVLAMISLIIMASQAYANQEYKKFFVCEFINTVLFWIVFIKK